MVRTKKVTSLTVTFGLKSILLVFRNSSRSYFSNQLHFRVIRLMRVFLDPSISSRRHYIGSIRHVASVHLKSDISLWVIEDKTFEKPQSVVHNLPTVFLKIKKTYLFANLQNIWLDLKKKNFIGGCMLILLSKYIKKCLKFSSFSKYTNIKM